AATWFDDAGRTTHQASYGDNGGSAFSRPGTPPEPDSSDDVIVHKTTFDLSGQVFQTIDNRGIVTRYTHDAAGRRTAVIENYVDGTPGPDEDRTTLYTYTADGQIATLTAKMPSGTNDQVTR